MIPIQLTIQGLYSYQEKQTIDFTQLTAANLFGIFGSVGCGKSSILEAITFALYGKTDRLNLSGDNRNYNMMNLKSNELLIDFIFETGKSQTAYRATVVGKRNSKNFEDVKKLDRKAYIKVDDEWTPIDTTALEHAIGLSYENFKRTIIIPQGQFQEFLQLGNKDRTQMMKELFNLGKYEFFYKVTALESKNNAAKQNIDGKLQQLGEIDREQIKAYKIQLGELDRTVKTLNEQLTAFQKNEENLRKLQQLTKKRVELEKLLKNLEDQQDDFSALTKKIERYEQAVILFKHLLDSLKTTIERQKNREKQIEKETNQQRTEEEAVTKISKLLEKIKPAYEKREELKKKSEDLNHILRIKELEISIKNENERLDKGTKVYNEIAKKLEQSKTNKTALEGKIKTGKKRVPDLSLLSTIKAWHIEKQNLDKQLKSISDDLKKNSIEIESIQKEFEEILIDSLFNELYKKSSYKEARQHLDSKTSQIKEQQNKIHEKENNIRVRAQLQAYSESLKEGKACPLCGSEQHPNILKADEFKTELEKLEKEKKQVEQNLDKIASLNNRIHKTETQNQLILKQKQELKDKLEKNQTQINAHSKLFIWDNYKDEADLNKAFDEAKSIQLELKNQETELDKLSKIVDKEEKDKERYQQGIDKIKISLAVHETELKTIGNQLRIIKFETYSEIPTKLIEEEKAKLINEYSRLEKEYTENNAQLVERTKKRDTLLGSLKANMKEFDQEEIVIEKLQKQITTQLLESNFETTDEVKQLLTNPINIEVEKQKLSAFNEALLKSKSQLSEVKSEIGTQVYNAEEHQKQEQDITALKQLIDEKNREQGKLTEQLKKLEKDLENQATLLKEKEKLELRAENIKTMKSLFKGSGFVNYISSVYLQNLCNAANDRFFQLTRQKLSLEITDDNNFQVRDFMNGGKIRSVKTLSGGQTFQAAMSLALALADNIQKITESNQNFFFLDEGFGSLDKESLSIVFDTLKSLRQENRIIGVISHVEEMQQEIDVHLRIENNTENGSKISASWEI